MPRIVLLVVALVGAFSATAAAAEAPSIRTIAGAGGAGYNGDGKPALSTRLSAPSGLVYDAAGNLFVADSGNHRIRRIGLDGTVTTVAGAGVGGFSGDGGPAVAAQLNFPRAIGVAADGTLYIADTGNNRVRRVTPDGTITTIAGTGVADVNTDVLPADQSILSSPAGIALDPGGRVVIADTGNGLVRRIEPDGTLVVIAGVIYNSTYNGDNQPATAAYLDDPVGLAYDATGNLLIAESDNHRVRRVDAASGLITTVAGIGAVYDSRGDGGAAAAAGLNQPVGVAVDAKGVIFVAELGGARVRRIGTDGRISTVAGTGEGGFGGDLGPATKAKLFHPSGLVVDPRGRLLIADTDNQRIRRVADLRPDLGRVAKAFVSARPGGPAKTRLTTEARQMCATFVFGEAPAAGLPITVTFTGPRTRVGRVGKPVRQRVVSCLTLASNARFRIGPWKITIEVAGRLLKTASVRVDPFDID
jgi:sugar lactone lactonase YvrE